MSLNIVTKYIPMFTRDSVYQQLVEIWHQSVMLHLSTPHPCTVQLCNVHYRTVCNVDPADLRVGHLLGSHLQEVEVAQNWYKIKIISNDERTENLPHPVSWMFEKFLEFCDTWSQTVCNIHPWLCNQDDCKHQSVRNIVQWHISWSKIK